MDFGFDPPPIGIKGVRERYGAKVARLLAVPPVWRPTFLVISTAVFRSWKADRSFLRRLDQAALDQQIAAAAKALGPKWLIRSSATDETVEDRGQHTSLPFDISQGPTAFVATLEQIFSAYTEGADGEMGLLVNPRIASIQKGFLSNEIRVAAKPYRWVLQSEVFHGRDIGKVSVRPLSAKQARIVSPSDPLICTSAEELVARARAVAYHFWREAQARCVIEWCWDGKRLWVVQLDVFERDTVGLDPRQLDERPFPLPSLEEGTIFKRYRLGESSPWNKLFKVNLFSTPGHPAPHRLFYARADRIAAALATVEGRQTVENEVNALTGGRAVLRTDAIGGGFNLSRTNTVTGSEAVSWMVGRLAEFGEGSRNADEFVFILHAFIQARCAAWSYYRAGSASVRVDGLWGLADGMQYYPTDTYWYDVEANAERTPTIRFKSHALLEQIDGTWTKEDVAPAYARHRALTKAEVGDIARRTVQISVNAGKDVQVMWFVGLPPELKLGSNLPWFTVTPEQSIEEVQSHLLRAVRVSSIEDLDKLAGLEPGAAKVVLEPSAHDVRSDDFVEAVAERCLELNLPVELKGSVLSHAFHQLKKAGVEVFVAEPGTLPLEMRQRKVFDKVVRDEIPEFISSKGEFVSSERLARSDLMRALVGKLIEEAEELLQAKAGAARIEELADVYELIRGLAGFSGVSLTDVAAKAEAKRTKRGGFERGVVLRETSFEPRDTSPQLFSTSDQPRTERHLEDFLKVYEDGGSARMPISLLLGRKPRTITLTSNDYSIDITAEIIGGVLMLNLRGIRYLGDESQAELFDEGEIHLG